MPTRLASKQEQEEWEQVMSPIIRRDNEVRELVDRWIVGYSKSPDSKMGRACIAIDGDDESIIPGVTKEELHRSLESLESQKLIAGKLKVNGKTNTRYWEGLFATSWAIDGAMDEMSIRASALPILLSLVGGSRRDITLSQSHNPYSYELGSTLRASERYFWLRYLKDRGLIIFDEDDLGGVIDILGLCLTPTGQNMLSGRWLYFPLAMHS